MTEYKKPIVVAEIGCNHMGDFNTAKELIELAKISGAHVAKFQKRTPKELLTPEQYYAPHPDSHHSYGNTYGAHREFLELTIRQHAQLKKYTEKLGMIYSTSVWDLTSAKEVTALNPLYVKVPSACNNHFDMLKILRDNYRGEVHIPFGMTTKKEEEEVVKFFEAKKQAKKRLVLYACTSGYPVPFEDICLLEIEWIKKNYSNRVKEIGFSGHHLGIAIDIAAYALGATWIERHFTKDRTLKGTDHAASLEPQGLATLTRNLGATYSALKFKNKEILDIENEQRKKLKYKKPVTNISKSPIQVLKLKKGIKK
ncbi:MAG: N-acetylneuraminate synthase family protein [Candidatus Paceibacterota bacterium]